MSTSSSGWGRLCWHLWYWQVELEQEQDDDDRPAAGSVDVVELLCDGGRVDPDEHDDDEKEDSATCDFPEFLGW